MNDHSLAFSAQAVVGHGLGETLSGFHGEVQVLLKGIPEELRRLDLGGEQLTHHWVHGRELKLRMFREGAGSSGSVELVVETRANTDDEPEHRGRYLLTVTRPPATPGGEGTVLKARGRASCSLG